ncbi:N-acetylglucosamine-6-phosphate deacetylase [Mangrovimicrobium sediminis]|uniref:N-acetylglucosamine-6-phosphate deacetylase n=1 Tax=Mangrovimicrobium sediminis TaxID=2562682 RepID=A0A4Z0M706_9GAMM|nr:N-acetylglucosamine-6-phosphate deacetylase [Haliea sp. SAOS-164]TGD75289.1 N-acetylglucosamine-6-phosphate deacetylase [Haliea sp. SAOS-164]
MGELIVNARVFDGEQMVDAAGVLLAEGRVQGVLSADKLPEDCPRFDLAGGTLLPGFVDLQVNGGGGVQFNDAPTVESLATIAAAHRRFGTTGFLPTLISDSYAKMREAAAAVDAAIAADIPGVLGIHFEGPFLNPGRCGIHDRGHLRPPDEEGLSILCAPRRGVTLVTLAPEVCDAQVISRLHRAGVIVAAGHTEASYEQAQAAMDAGLRGFTHLYNAMSPLASRAPGAVGAALGDDRAWFGIIADGHHSHPAALRVALRAKPPGGALLVTDAMATVGAENKRFTWNGEQIEARGGCLRTAAGTLAGSDLDMLSAVDNAARFADIDWFEAARMASLYPATALGLEAELGCIRPGARACLLALDDARRPLRVWVDGRGYTPSRA